MAAWVPSMTKLFWCVASKALLAQTAVQLGCALSCVKAEVLPDFSLFWSRMTRTVTLRLQAARRSLVKVGSSSAYIVMSMDFCAALTRA